MATTEERDPLVPRHCKHNLASDYQSRSKETSLTATDAVFRGCTVSLPNCAEVSSDRDETEEHIAHIRFPPENGSVTSSSTFQDCSVFSKVLCSGIPLTFLASCFGLWPIRKKWQFIIFAIVMIVSSGIFILSAYVCVSCYVTIDSANHTCLITGKSASRGVLIEILSYFIYLLAPFPVLLSNLLLFHYVVKSRQREGVTSFLAALRKTSDLEWFLINVQIFTTFLTRVVVLILYLNELPSQYSFAFYILTLFLYISSLNMSVACWIFAMITCALRKKVSSFYRAIRMHNVGNLDDIIDLHQNLCDDVFSTCRALQPWFVSHWIFYGTLTAGTVFLGVLDFKHNPYLLFYVVMVVYLFLLPCFYAARLTSKCQDVLREFNYTRARDWGVAHPLRSRVTLNHFLFYAVKVGCGFRVFSFNFGESFAWLSLVFGVVAMVAKVLYTDTI